MNWETAKLGEVCAIEKGNIGIMKAVPGEYPLVVLGEERKTHNEFQFDAEAVIIPLVSSTGHGHRSMKRIFFQTGKFSVGSILCAVIPKDKTQLSAEFLYRYLDLNKENELVARMKGMANVSLSMKEIADVEIPLPSLEVQQEFIEKFQRLESGRNQISTELNQQVALVKELRQAYLREAMQGQLVSQDLTDEPAEILLEKIKAEKYDRLTACHTKAKPLPPIKPEEIPFEIPSTWTWCRFADVALIESNLVSPFDYPNLPHVAPDNIEKNTGKLLPYKTVLEDEVKSANHYFYPQQLIYSKVRPKLNKVVLVEFEGLCSADMYPIKPLIDSRFLQAGMLSQYFLEEVDKFDNRVKMPKINQNQLSQIPIPLPPLAEQERIVARLEKLMRFCDELEANIRRAKTNAEALVQVALKEALESKTDC